MSWDIDNRGAPLRVVVTKNLPGQRWRDVLKAAGCEIHVSRSRDILSVAEIRAAIGERCDGAIGQLTEDWGAELFDALKRAGGRAYSNYAVGYDNVRVEEATRRGIAVGNTPGVLTETTAEMAVALTFAAARRIPEADQFVREGRFRGWLPDLFLGKRLWGGTLGVVGAGRIGSSFARMLAPGHNMNVLYWDQVDRPELEASLQSLGGTLASQGEHKISCRRVASLEELLASSDVISLHVSLNDATRHLINAQRLARLREDAILVNTSRGPVIDEAALVEHLQSHPRFRVGLDVFEDEPRLASGLAACPNAVMVPHIASATDWTREGMATLAACNVAGVLRGLPLASDLQVEAFLSGAIPAAIPSLVNAAGLGRG